MCVFNNHNHFEKYWIWIYVVLLCVAMPRCHPVMQYWYCNAMS